MHKHCYHETDGGFEYCCLCLEEQESRDYNFMIDDPVVAKLTGFEE